MALKQIYRGMQNGAEAIESNFNEIEAKLNAQTATALWSGASFLSAAHTINLSKSINDCASGIALKFNPYNTSSGSSYTSQTSWFIIPKHHVSSSASGQNTFCPIFKQDGTFVGAKVVTISPTKLVGADVNALGALYGYVLTGVYEV